MEEFFQNYNTQLLIVFRVFVVLEFLWKHYILLLEFKSEEAMDTKDKMYFRIIIVYAFVSFLLSFFLASKYILLFILLRLVLFTPRFMRTIIEDIKESKLHKSKMNGLYVGFVLTFLGVILGLLIGFVYIS